MKTSLPRLLVAALATCVFASACASGSGGDSGQGSEPGASNFPERDLTLIAASDPGGGLDLASRAVKEALDAENLLDVSIQVETIGGGGGNPARAALLSRPADGYTVVAETNRVFLNPLIGTTDIQSDRFVPIAKLMTEYLVWVVRADSEFKDAGEILDALKQDPTSVSFGVATVPSDDQFNILRPIQAAGVDVTQVSVTTFSGGGDLLTNLLGGRVDVISTGVGELGGIEGTEVRIVSVSAPEPQGGALEGVPTWRELGIDFELDHWRGIFGPADMPKEAVEWWASTLEEMSKTKTWLDRLAQNGWTPDFEPPDVFATTVSTQEESAREIIEQLGLKQ